MQRDFTYRLWSVMAGLILSMWGLLCTNIPIVSLTPATGAQAQRNETRTVRAVAGPQTVTVGIPGSEASPGLRVVGPTLSALGLVILVRGGILAARICTYRTVFTSGLTLLIAGTALVAASPLLAADGAGTSGVRMMAGVVWTAVLAPAALLTGLGVWKKGWKKDEF
ncbi:hypothetical protein JW916_00585 [Candidatus Sumerlaeota bacterium]|nr:hypothetical protein [Candidatus Sumerlaeota bacterium]